MTSPNPRNTIVLLEMHPISDKANGKRIFRIWPSGVGSNLDRAERELNSAIKESEDGQRDLVPLHRLRAEQTYSKATTLAPIEDVLSAVHAIAGAQVALPLEGFFELTKEQAIGAIEAGIVEYETEHAKKKMRQAEAEKAKKARQARAETARQTLEPKQRTLGAVIKKVVLESTPHTKELRDTLDGIEGKALQSWAEKELRRQRKALEKKIEEVRRLDEIMGEYLSKVDLDLFELCELQMQISDLDDESVVLTESEEMLLGKLKDDAENFYFALDNWRDELPPDQYELADLMIDEVKDGRRHLESFENLARRVLVNQ